MVNQTFQRNNIYRDFDLSFSRNPLTNDVAKKTDDNAITQSIRNLLGTAYYERPFRPRVGTNLRKILFEPADFITMSDLKSGIEEVIINYEPRIQLIDVHVADLSEKNAYAVKIVYKFQNIDEAKSINVTLKRLR